jgi:hypothetical protein
VNDLHAWYHWPPAMNSALSTLSIIAVAVVVSACGGSTADSSGSTDGGSGSGGSGGSGTGGTGGGSSCTSSSECGNGVCGFPVDGGCSAVGTCFPAPTSSCNAYSPGCACDGTEISVICTGFPGGYVEKPLAHEGVCVEDAGAPFACGEALSCDPSSQYCKIAVGGPCCAPPSFSCEAIPVACADDHSCNCIQPAVGGQECEAANSGVTVTFLYP